MIALSFCLSRSNSWILELHIWNALPASHGLVATSAVKGAWVAERQMKDKNLSEDFFSVIYFHGNDVLSLFLCLFICLFVLLHLGT